MKRKLIETHKDRWEQGFKALSKFRRRKGHCRPSRHHLEGERNLPNAGYLTRHRRVITSYETGNGKKPTSLPPQPGCWIVAPFLPHERQRARCHRRSLDTSAPHRMTATAQASGACC